MLPLMERIENAPVTRIPSGDIIVSGIKYRSVYEETDECRQLLDSIAVLGVTQAGLLRPYFDKEKNEVHPTKRELVDGGHRFWCSNKLGYSSFPGKIVDLTDDEVLQLQIVLNERRLKTKPIDQLNQIMLFIGRHPDYSPAQVAKALVMWPTQIYDILKLKNLSKEAAELVTKGGISAGNAYALGKFIPAEYQTSDWPESTKGGESILDEAQKMDGAPFADFCSKLRKAINKGEKVVKENLGPIIVMLSAKQIKEKLERAEREVNSVSPVDEDYSRLLGRYQMTQEICGIDELALAERRALKSANENTSKLKLAERKAKLAEESAQKAKKALAEQRVRLNATTTCKTEELVGV